MNDEGSKVCGRGRKANYSASRAESGSRLFPHSGRQASLAGQEQSFVGRIINSKIVYKAMFHLTSLCGLSPHHYFTIGCRIWKHKSNEARVFYCLTKGLDVTVYTIAGWMLASLYTLYLSSLHNKPDMFVTLERLHGMGIRTAFLAFQPSYLHCLFPLGLQEWNGIRSP
jgi:hypothetical protein